MEWGVALINFSIFFPDPLGAYKDPTNPAPPFINFQEMMKYKELGDLFFVIFKNLLDCLFT